MKLLFLTNVPSPYRVDFFNELGKYCELTVLFEKNTSNERDDSWKKYTFENFRGIIMKGVSLGADVAFCPSVTRYLKKEEYDHIICTGFNSPTTMLAISWLRKHKKSYYLESDGGFAKSGQGLKERIKKHFIRGAKGYFSTAEENDKYYLVYGAKKEQIIRYPFSSVYDANISKTVPSREEKQQLRKKLNMVENYIVLYVGRMLQLKGIDVLLYTIQKANTDIGFYLVGGESPEEYRYLTDKLTNVHFISFMNKEGLSEYYKASDIFVMPTRGDVWGLVINEAMGYGLPVISTDRCIAALEMVKDKQSGIIVPTENSDAMAKAINDLLNDNELRKQYAENALKISRKYTIETMAHRHLEILDVQDFKASN